VYFLVEIYFVAQYPPVTAKPNKLYYGDNLEILEKNQPDESVDLCYIDPPFNSKRDYNQIYDSHERTDRAQAWAYLDTWTWNEMTDDGFHRILSNHGGRFTEQTIDLVNGLTSTLKRNGLNAYLINMAVRVAEIYRVLKPTGTFYLHCNPAASHYLKLVLGSLFLPRGGQFRNEIIWCYRGGGVPRSDFARKHQTIFRYSKTHHATFNVDAVRIPYSEDVQNSPASRYDKSYRDNKVYEGYRPNPKGKHPEDWWPIQPLMPSDKKERCGYPTQKPKTLLNRIILSSSNPGDVVLDAYCGCGTSIEVAHREDRRWIGIDITYQAISTVINRLEDELPGEALKTVAIAGLPRDLDSARALAHKKDDRLRKEFEKWAILTYTKNRAAIHERKGADGGIDGVVYFQQAAGMGLGKMVLQAKSGHVQRNDVATLRGDLDEQRATIAALITLEPPSKPMLEYAQNAGRYTNQLTGQTVYRIQIITVEEMIEKRPPARFEMPLDLIAIRREILESEGQTEFDFKDATKPSKRKPSTKEVEEMPLPLFARKKPGAV
jgi:DNA modification methylase